ncbi:expressed unknown protein [Seminavis robusta]|uniref:Uncharacterized protein n=1 Tax=Seminavis robusta TaxID=568900 RepID=A0A9N8E4I8_9STRA|nr:expressed unknown protein [Seminavis robusta]|eukprot:Sro493_g154050.1 n/a (127) ;mRNA; f:22028-22408
MSTTSTAGTKTILTTPTDPRDRYVGIWKLVPRVAPWFMLGGVTTIRYNADGDLILHTEIEVGIQWLGIKKMMDSGFARVDEKGHFRCIHTKDHLEFQIHLDNENKADMKEYIGNKVTRHLQWIRES